MTLFESMQMALHSYTEHSSSYDIQDSLHSSKAIFSFDDGLPGFRDDKRFELTPHPTFSGCFYFASCDHDNRTFLCLPLDNKKGPIDREDLIKASQSIKSRFDDCAFFALLSLQSAETGHIIMTANLKAPLVMDLLHRKGKQVILSGNYEASHLLATFEGKK